MRREYISICRRPITWTEPARQIRLLSLRSTSVHIVSSDSSFLSDKICLIRSASSNASRPRRIVPEIGHVSQRHPLALRSTRTNISGLAPTRYSVAPRLRRKPYGDGLRWRRRRNTSDGGAGHGS